MYQSCVLYGIHGALSKKKKKMSWGITISHFISSSFCSKLSTRMNIKALTLTFDVSLQTWCGVVTLHRQNNKKTKRPNTTKHKGTKEINVNYQKCNSTSIWSRHKLVYILFKSPSSKTKYRVQMSVSELWFKGHTHHCKPKLIFTTLARWADEHNGLQKTSLTTEGDVKEFSACYHVFSLAKFGFTTFQMVYTSNLTHTHTHSTF